MLEEFILAGSEDVFHPCLERSGEVRVFLVESALEPVPGLAFGFCAYFFDSHFDSIGNCFGMAKVRINRGFCLVSAEVLASVSAFSGFGRDFWNGMLVVTPGKWAAWQGPVGNFGQIEYSCTCFVISLSWFCRTTHWHIC